MGNKNNRNESEDKKGSNDPLIRLKNFSLSVNGKLLIGDWNFDIFRGDVIAVLGRNGSGKTTLIRTIAGLIEPSRGSIEKQSGVKVSYMPQAMKINPNVPITVSSFMLLQTSEVDKELINALGFEHAMNNKLGSISGGELQKVLFYNAIKSNADLVILDEPENHLDDQSIEAVTNVIKRSKDRAFLVVSHERQTITGISNHILEIGNLGITCKKHDHNCARQ